MGLYPASPAKAGIQGWTGGKGKSPLPQNARQQRALSTDVKFVMRGWSVTKMKI